MPVKRSRIGRSSSFGDTGVLSPPVKSADGSWLERRAASPSSTTVSPSNCSKALKRSVAEESAESPRRILTLSSPVQEAVDSSEKEPISEFLDKCYHCKKQIHENAEVFMYSYLRAFCTVECRDRQIAIDSEMEKASGTFRAMQLSPPE